MTPQEIAERLLSYGQAKEPTPVALALVEAAARFEQRDKSLSFNFSLHEVERMLGPDAVQRIRASA